MEVLKGRAWKVGHNIDTDLIIPARYLNRYDADFLASHCLEDIFPQLGQRINPGDILVAGRNFGCGSSREHAPVALKSVGFSCVIAESYARIFYRNAINIGLPVIVAPEAAQSINDQELLEVDPAGGLIRSLSSGRTYRGELLPPFMLEILDSGGLVPHVAGKVGRKCSK